MDLSRYFSVKRRERSRDTQDPEDDDIQSYLPLLASPINENAREVLSSCASDVEKSTAASSTAETSVTILLAGGGRTSSGNIIIYKPHHEASSIELFYDLFFVANLVFPRGKVGLEEQITWVAIAIVEGLVVLLVAMTWRIVSFKHTHIVERLQLLTLIIIGEGIIGMIKSVACITKGQAKNNSTELGSVVAAVLLLYLMYMLYFDQFSKDRFGTLRQQIWSLLHYPLHMAIVICVEANTSLLVWNSAVQALKFMWTLEPDSYLDPADGFNDSASYVAYLEQSMLSINSRFRSKRWNATYDWKRNLTAIDNYTTIHGFRTDMWNEETGELVRSIFTKAQTFVFEAHADTLAKLNAVAPIVPVANRQTQQAQQMKLDAIYDVFNVTVMAFYIGAGAMLLVLAILYWFNKMHKTKYEFGEMINRVWSSS
ncbi:hypothetical protein N0V94_003469 [Neodidymelliopsis sp. IMI 364377]|nr:hypothetical protein N0V94_003469 [Neodidymelliopsis sp. IMI 364377]